jgi:hypothetical protein
MVIMSGRVLIVRLLGYSSTLLPLEGWLPSDWLSKQRELSTLVQQHLNELAQGPEWTHFFLTGTRIQQMNDRKAPSTQDSSSSRITRPERKILGASGTAARGKDHIL